MPTSLPRSQESKRYYNMVTTLVFPAIVEKFKHMRVREVTMQQDGARCHIPVSYTHLTLPTILRV